MLDIENISNKSFWQPLFFEAHPLIYWCFNINVEIKKKTVGAKNSGNPNWPEKTKPERLQAEQCRNATVQNDVKRNKAE
jgi:hypothetical protein